MPPSARPPPAPRPPLPPYTTLFRSQISDSTLNQKDSIITPPDSTQSMALYTTLNPGTYKFILENAGKKRALTRYNLLKSYGMDIKIDRKSTRLNSSHLVTSYAALCATPTRTATSTPSLHDALPISNIRFHA